jgi:hypothetical protein
MPAPPPSPSTLLASLPAHLGRPLNPPEAVVIGWNDDADTEHAVVATLNLACDDPADEYELARTVVADGAETACVVVAVTERSERSAPTAASHARFVAAALHRFGVQVLDTLTVVGDRWRSLACTDPTCCPPEGSPMPHAVTPEETL